MCTTCYQSERVIEYGHGVSLPRHCVVDINAAL